MYETTDGWTDRVRYSVACVQLRNGSAMRPKGSRLQLGRGAKAAWQGQYVAGRGGNVAEPGTADCKKNQSPKGNMWSAIPVALLRMLVIVGDG